MRWHSPKTKTHVLNSDCYASEILKNLILMSSLGVLIVKLRVQLEEVNIYVNAATAANCVLPPTSLVNIIFDGHAMGLEEDSYPYFDEDYASVEEIPVS
jgi:hypothetical protein